MIKKFNIIILLFLLLFCAKSSFAQECRIPCYLYQSNVQTIDSIRNDEIKFYIQIRHISDSVISVGPVISKDTNEDCHFIILKLENGNWYVKSENSFHIFYDKEKDYLADCCISTCEKTILSKRHQLVIGAEHLYPFEILFWGVTSCDTPTYLFHKTFGLIGMQDNYGYDYFREDFLEYILQKTRD